MSAVGNAFNKYGLAGVWRDGWKYYPAVMVTGGLAIASIGGMLWYVNTEECKTKENKKYKNDYIVYRHDDPRVARVRKD